MKDCYQFLDSEINNRLKVTVGFNALIGAKPYYLSQGVLKGFYDRYSLIKRFQEITLSLFNASLHGEFDPELASLILSELSGKRGFQYHKKLTSRQHRTPVFFRTDEVIPGKFSEIQCPGSTWGLYEQLYLLYEHFSPTFKTGRSFPRNLAEGFSASLRRYLGKDPVIHHLLDNASIPHGVRYFIQRSRKHGLHYFSYDKDITPYDCNFVRSHDFVGLYYNNFAKQRLSDCEKGLCFYDLPPSGLFEAKIIQAFPFWDKTSGYYSDEIRKIFPYTQLIRPDGFLLEDGTRISIEQFCRLSQKNRHYYVKYAGSDVNLNWGSKGVFFCSTLSGISCKNLFDKIVEEFNQGRYWIIQKGYRYHDTARFITRGNSNREEKTYTKFSGFYGPDGLMGVLVMQKCFNKVHGSAETVMSICG